MPLKSGRFTSKEELFLQAYAETGNREVAEKRAKLAPAQGWKVLQREPIQREIVARQVAILTSEALPAAVSVVLEIMRNPKAPAAARVQAAKLTFDRVLPSHAEAGAKEPHEMTPEELASAIDKLESIAAGKAKPMQEIEGPKPGVFD
jgi:hypothetical protein